MNVKKVPAQEVHLEGDRRGLLRHIQDISHRQVQIIQINI